jgi:hypothetical protein
LITVATAVHWFELEPFYQVVRRVTGPEGIIAVWTYHLPAIVPSIDSILRHYYAEVLAGFWPERFHYLDDRYGTLPFPFEEIQPPEFEMQADWELGQLVGFLDSWSATRRYQESLGQHPLRIIWQRLSKSWGEPGARRKIRWRLYLRVGRVK